MPMYHYEATDRHGKSVVGSMDARDEGAVRARLAQGGYTPTLIETSAGARPASGSGSRRTMGGAAGSTLAGPQVAAGQRPVGDDMADDGSRPGVSVSNRDLAQFYRQMATSLRSGVPLTQALPAIKGRVREKVMQRALDDLEAAVARGRPIIEAMANHPRVFSLGHIGLVRAGEGGGFLDRAFEELATQAEADWGIEAATRFNILLFIIKWMAVPFLVTWLYFMVNFIPMMAGGIDFNAMGRIGVGALLAGAATAVVLNVVLPVLWKLAKGTRFGDLVNNLTSSIPVVNARRKRVDAVKSLSSLASAMAAGIPPTIAWQLASEAADTPRFRQAMAAQRHAVRQGVPLPEILTATRLFDRDTLDMVRSGEVSGNMPEMLDQAVRYQREEAKHIGNLTPWILAMFAYFLILVIAAAMFIWAASGVYGGIIQRGLDL